MRTSIISIGNSRGIRIPKPLLEESGLSDEVEIKVKKGEIRIIASATVKELNNIAQLSEKTLAKDWNRQAEDEAWRAL